MNQPHQTNKKPHSVHCYKITSFTTFTPRCLNDMTLSKLSCCLWFVTQCLLQECKRKANQPSDLHGYLSSFLSDAGK